MAEPTRERLLNHLQEKGLLTDEQVREALRVVEEAARDGQEVPLPEVLQRVGVVGDEVHQAAAAFEAGEVDARVRARVADPAMFICENLYQDVMSNIGRASGYDEGL